MAFRNCYNFKNRPLRLYTHRFGEELFNNSIEAFCYTEAALATLDSVAPDSLFYIAVTWGDKKTKSRICDLFAYSGINEWPGNPDVSSWIFNEGVLKQENPITCGDTMILLGLEEQYRRSCSDLSTYLSNGPVLPKELLN